MTIRTTFTTPYQQHADREGQPFEVLAKVTEPGDHHDAEVLPMYRIRFQDGTEVDAWPEEVEEPDPEAVLVINSNGKWTSVHHEVEGCHLWGCHPIDTSAYFDHVCTHCDRGIDLHGGEFYATVEPGPDGGWVPNPECTDSPDGHVPNRNFLVGPPRQDPIPLHVETVAIGNDFTDELEWDLYATAGIVYEDGPHQGVRFIVPGNDRDACDQMRALVEASPLPYTIVSIGGSPLEERQAKA